MADYKALVKTEAETLFKECHPEFANDQNTHGGKSSAPNFSKWLDLNAKLNGVVGKVVSNWTLKDYQWVQNNTKNPNRFGDPRSNAFGSLYSDILHELKKLSKNKRS